MNLKGYGSFIANIFIAYLILSAFGNVIYNIYTSGLPSIFVAHNYTPAIVNLLLPNQISIRYVAYGFSLLFFGIYLSILWYKYRSYALPLFLISYTLWDSFGILNHVYSNGGFETPYIQFQIIAYISLFCAVYLYKKKLLIVKWNFGLFIFWFITNQTSVNQWLIDASQGHMSIYVFFAYVPFLAFTYYSFRIDKFFSPFNYWTRFLDWIVEDTIQREIK